MSKRDSESTPWSWWEGAARLQEARKRTGLTQEQLNDKMNTYRSRSSVSDIETGKTVPHADTLRRLCEYLNVSADWLLGLPSYAATKVQEHDGLEWTEDIPDDIDGEVRDEIKFGIDLFHKLIVENQDIAPLVPNEGRDWSAILACMKAALRSGALRIRRVTRNEDLEAKVRDKYGLNQVIVADVPSKHDGLVFRVERVAFLAATEALKTAAHSVRIGLGGGYTMLRMTELASLPTTTFSNTHWVPLQPSDPKTLNPYSSEFICVNMARKYQKSETETFQRGDDSAYSENPAICEMWAAFVTASGPGRVPRSGQAANDFNFWTADQGRKTVYPQIYGDHPEIHETFGGEMLGRFVDRDGELIELEELERYRPINFKDLRSCARQGNVWVIAARAYKARPTLAAIRGKFVNNLVIDSEIAEFLLHPE